MVTNFAGYSPRTEFGSLNLTSLQTTANSGPAMGDHQGLHPTPARGNTFEATGAQRHHGTGSTRFTIHTEGCPSNIGRTSAMAR